MTCYSVNVVVSGLDLDDPKQNQALAALPYAAVPASIAGVTSVEVEIESESVSRAWKTIDADLRKIGLSAQRLDPDLVNAAEIALRLGVNRETVRLWSKGERRQSFPVPFATAANTVLWRWADVHEWAVAESLVDQQDEETPFPADLVDDINGILARRRLDRVAQLRLGERLSEAG